MKRNYCRTLSELLQNEEFMNNEESHSILEAIYNVYFENQGYPDGLIREYYQDFDQLTDQLSPTQKDRIHSSVADLCTEYERKAFTDGFKMGVCFILELIK